MSKVRLPFKPPRLIRPEPTQTQTPATAPEIESKSFTSQVQWRKKTLKKNKTWDGDGKVEVNQNEVCLKNSDGKVLVKKAFTKLPNFDEIVSIGNYEIEIDQIIEDPPVKKAKTLVTKPINPTPVIQYDSPNAITITDTIKIDPILSAKLRPHQVEGVKFLFKSLQDYSGCLLADEMGLGKTLTTITTIWTLYKQARMKKFLIVCPVTLINNWKSEFRKWLGNKMAISNNERQDIVNFGKLNVYQVLIVNYEKLHYPELATVPIDLLICDEGHRLKNSSSKVLQSLIALNVPKKIVLTGTPIQNELLEFYTLVNFLNPSILPDLKTFQKKFVNPITRSRDLHCLDREKGDEASKQLVDLTSKFILRRTQEIMNHLPKKTDILLFVPPTSKQVQLFESKNYEHSFQLINTFRKICNSPSLTDESLPVTSGKIRVLIPLLIECISQKEKVVLISNYTTTLTLLEDIIKKLNFTFLRLDGSTANNIRNSLVQQFNKSNINIFLLSSKSGGMGINLVGASRLILFDNDWNPSMDLQSLSRIHRDGQDKPCFLYRLFTTGCIDEKIFQRQLLKLKLSSRFLGNDKDSVNDFDYNDLKNLFEVDTDTKSNTHDLICDCKGDGELIEYVDEPLVTEWISAADFKDNEVKKSAVKLALNDYRHYKPDKFLDDPVLKNVIRKVNISFIMSKVS